MWLPMGIGVVADRAGLTTALGCFALLGVVMVAVALWLGRHFGNRAGRGEAQPSDNRMRADPAG